MRRLGLAMLLVPGLVPGLVTAGALLAGSLSRGDDAKPSLDDRIKAVLPKPEEERWLKIHWRSDLAQGRCDANAAGKPLFLWLMDGDPLGCT